MPSEKEIFEQDCIRILRLKGVNLPQSNPIKHERPDFVWPKLEEPLGVEITKLFKRTPEGKRPMQVQEAEVRAITELTRKIYEKKGFPPIEVRISFGNVVLNKTDRKGVALQLLTVIEQHIPQPGDWISIDELETYDVLPNGICRISILRFNGKENNLWSSSQAGWIQEDFITELQIAIDKKNKVLSEYLKKCSKCWLVVASDARGGSSFFRAKESTISHAYYSLFNRTFYIEGISGKVIELKTINQKK